MITARHKDITQSITQNNKFDVYKRKTATGFPFVFLEFN